MVTSKLPYMGSLNERIQGDWSKEKVMQQRDDDIKNLILNESLDFPENVSEELIDLLEIMLAKSPSSRGWIGDLVEHPFFTKQKIPATLPAKYLHEEPKKEFINFFCNILKVKVEKKKPVMPEINKIVT
jgi:serine/threonine protein kinase